MLIQSSCGEENGTRSVEGTNYFETQQLYKPMDTKLYCCQTVDKNITYLELFFVPY